MLNMSMPGEEFVKSLVKRVITLVVTWNVVILCLIATLIVMTGVIGGLAASASPASTGSSYTPIYGQGLNQLLSIKISGVIVGTQDAGGGLFDALDSQTSGYSVKETLISAADDDSIKGIILEIDSPGGTIYGSHAIADGVAYYKQQTNKPVYAHISGSGASGAYWAAVSADKVMVDYGSDVGSIGVIMGPFQYYNKVIAEDGGLFGGGVITEGGVETVTLTAGKSKDVGNPYRRLTQEEINSLQRSVNNEYDGFVQFVARQRDISEDVIRNQIGAMIYDPKTALELKLVDSIGSRQDAYADLAKDAGVAKDYFISQEEYVPGFFESLLGVVTRQPQPQAKAVDLCTLTGAKLAYHGDVTAWCQK